jgi:Ice-binding-like/Secretion system C-terminal sorting domain
VKIFSQFFLKRNHMNTPLQYSLFSLFLLLIPNINFAQAPNLGSTASFALFTAAGAFSNDGNTVVTGDIGTNAGAFTGFPPGIVNGQIYVADATSAQAAIDVEIAFMDLSLVTCGPVLGVNLGNDQTLTPNVYCIGAASTLNGDLILDGQCDPDALFIIKINGALATGISSNVKLTNSASLCNVYWQINGAVALGNNSVFRGTIVANGAISLLDGATLFGRGLSREGAIALHTNVVDNDMQPTAAVITADGPTTFCAGDSVVLSGNCGGTWSNGETTPTITVTTSGDYFVTTTNACGSAISNHIIVTVNPLPICTITGDNFFCTGQSTELCAPIGLSIYLWSTGETTTCITVSAAGNYGLTVTDANSCSSICSKVVGGTPPPICTITGEDFICTGQSTDLCALAGLSSYLWSTGETTDCITVSAAGSYGLTITDANGCSSICSKVVGVNPLPICTITGDELICMGQSTELCAPAGLSGYLWSTGETTSCITVSAAGNYGLTITDANGCSSTCSIIVTVNPPPICTITGNNIICDGQSAELCTPPGAASYLWNTGATTNCISTNLAGSYSVTITYVGGCSSVCSETVVVNSSPICTITGNNTICEGQSAELCTPPGAVSYLWSTGANTNCINVNMAGNYSVTVTDINGCSSVCSETITINPLPICTITGNNILCEVQFTELCTPPGAASYLWSTGANTNCINVNMAGNYFVSVTDINGCSSVCSQTVTVSPPPICTITGNNIICEGQSAELCAPSGAVSYLWSTGATTNCISTNLAGSYSVTITYMGGCSSVCSETVVVNPAPICTITGNNIICEGQSAELCTPPGAASYLWSTGATTNCISTNLAGSYSVTITYVGGCSSVCSETVVLSTPSICTITGNDCLCPGQPTQLCASPTAASFLWSTGEVTSCIFVSSTGTYSVTITNADGCSSVCSKTIIPVLPPVIICPADVTVECDESTLPSNTGTAVANSNCNLAPTIVFNDVNLGGTCPNEFTISRTWTATNDCGISSSCIQIISVIDNEAPLIDCPANITVQCADQVPPVNISLVVTSDNCGGLVTVTHTGDVITNQTCLNSFTLTRNYLATDACGNTAACAQIITGLDNAPPEILFADSLLLNGDTLWVQCFGQNPEWDLPFFDEGSILAEDSCTGVVTVVFNQYQQGDGNCENGIINLYRLSWIATDACGNSDSVSISLALIDTISPVIFGVPADITVSCNEIPPLPDSIFATDGCLCACILLVEESQLIEGCQNGQVIVRSWTAKDQCGNQTTATQTITLVDDTGPTFLILQAELEGVGNGTILNYTCAEGGIPAFFGDLNYFVVLDTGFCGNAYILSFDVDTLIAANCEDLGFMEQQTYTWVAVDDCGNLSTMSIFVRLTDTEAPVFTGVLDTACLVMPWLSDVEATDNCGQTFVLFQDFNIPNPCGNGVAIRRIYEALDLCGNSVRDTSILIPNDQIPPVIHFINPLLAEMQIDETLTLNCDAQNGQYTSFGIEDVHVEEACAGLNLTFSEVLIAPGDCLANGIVATLELRWTATDLCGNSSTLTVIANIVDETSPVFVEFVPDISIGCNDDLPLLFATDNCGEITLQTTWDSIIYTDCAFQYELQRLVTATDECAYTTTLLQTIHVGNGGSLTFAGIIEVVCDEVATPLVTAFDNCAGEFVEVEMVADTLDSPCGGMIIERTWSATDGCWHTASSRQTIIVNDTIPPVFSSPFNSFVYSLLNSSNNVISVWQTELLFNLSVLDSSSVSVKDDCEQAVDIVFTVDTLKAENCFKNGYLERRTYTWTATDFCGNAATIFFVVDIVDDVSPVFVVVPVDVTIVCDSLPVVPTVFTEDPAQPVTITFTETMMSGKIPGSFIVTRTWTATDACGNVSDYTQTITWIPDTMLECNIIAPASVECNTHGVLICSEDSGGMGGNSFQWDILGEDCFIQGNPDTDCILIYVGWSPVELTLTVTDSFGCVSTCVTTLDCDIILNNSSFPETHSSMNPALNYQSEITRSGSAPVNYLQHLSFYPNPAVGTVNLRFESLLEGEVEFRLMNLLGELVFQDNIMAQEGLNTHEVDVRQLPEGSYLMQVKTKEEIHTKVIVIMRND